MNYQRTFCVHRQKMSEEIAKRLFPVHDMGLLLFSMYEF